MCGCYMYADTTYAYSHMSHDVHTTTTITTRPICFILSTMSIYLYIPTTIAMDVWRHIRNAWRRRRCINHRHDLCRQVCMRIHTSSIYIHVSLFSSFFPSVSSLFFLSFFALIFLSPSFYLSFYLSCCCC